MRALTLLLLACALPASAEVELQAVRWQVAGGAKEEAGKPSDVQAIPLDAQGKLPGRLRARLKLLNRGPAVEGVLLRYELTARISPAGPSDAAPAPIWAVAFSIDEKRVPKLDANQFKEVDLDPTAALTIYLKRLQNAGYAARTLMLEVMVEPRPGQPASEKLESSIPFGS